MQGVLVNKEKLPGYNDAAVKRTFAEAYTAFTEQGFRRRMDKERRVEDLVLIFYSNATKALQKGRAAEDDSWKGMVDRHVALFVRLLSSTLKDNGNDRDRPELMSRLSTLEKKLLTDDQDLTDNTGQKDTFIEVTVPLSYDIKDMPMVQVVAKVFGKRNSEVQSDIDVHRNLWTEEAALRDLKSYQHRLNANSKRTLRADDFETEEAYQSWKKAEAPDLVTDDTRHYTHQAELAKSSVWEQQAFTSISPNRQQSEDRTSKCLQEIFDPIDMSAPFGFEQPVDISGLSFSG